MEKRLFSHLVDIKRGRKGRWQQFILKKRVNLLKFLLCQSNANPIGFLGIFNRQLLDLRITKPMLCQSLIAVYVINCYPGSHR